MGYLLSFFLLAACAVGANAGTAVQELRSLLAETDSIRGHFTQVVRSEEGETLQESEGDIIVQRPLRLRWETTQPYHYLVVTNGETLWRYDADLEQMNEEAFSVDLARAPMLILTTSTEELAHHFEVAHETRKDRDVYTLDPRGEAAFEQLRLYFQQRRLKALELDDSLGQTTRMELRDAVFNREHPAETFVFSGAADAESTE